MGGNRFGRIGAALLVAGAAAVAGGARPAHAAGPAVTVTSEWGVVTVTDAPGDALVIDVTDTTITTSVPAVISNIAHNGDVAAPCVDEGHTDAGYVTECRNVVGREIHLGDGDDHATVHHAGGSPVRVSADAGNDTVVAFGTVLVRGGDGDDHLSDWSTAGAPASELDGGAGNDTIWGSWGALMEGGLGNDTLIATAPFTWMYGGDGADVFQADQGTPGAENHVSCGGKIHIGDHAVDTVRFAPGTAKFGDDCVVSGKGKSKDRLLLTQ